MNDDNDMLQVIAKRDLTIGNMREWIKTALVLLTSDCPWRSAAASATTAAAAAEALLQALDASEPRRPDVIDDLVRQQGPKP